VAGHRPGGALVDGRVIVMGGALVKQKKFEDGGKAAEPAAGRVLVY
jgi:hypothetical protein